jgi:hypothetical protein
MSSVPSQCAKVYKGEWTKELLWTSLGSGGLRGAAAVLQYPRGYCLCEREARGPAARAVRGTGKAGRGASPTAGKREDFSF